MTRVIWALPGVACEPALVGAAPGAGIAIVRRCVDAADLLACAAAEPAAPVVLDPGVPRLDAEIVRRVRAGGRTVVGVAADDADADRLGAWGLPVARLAADPAEAVAAIARALRASDGPAALAVTAPGVFTPRDRGRVIAVWGPGGSPGRTATAIAIADELAARGLRTCLVDADLRAPSIAVALGIVDASSGVLALARQADSGLVDTVLPARSVRPGLAVLTGLPHPSRWPDVRPAALSHAIAACARAFDAVVVDPGPAPVASPGTGPTGDHDPDACATACLEAADAVVGVGRDDVLGLARLAWAWASAWPAPSAIAMPCALGLVEVPGAPRGGRRALAEAGIAVPVEAVPWERGWAKALSAGATLAETAPRSSARRAYRSLAGTALAACG